VEDPSVFVRFRSLDERDTYFLVWTTTPWTLPANLLLAVHPEVDYVWVHIGEETLILARDLLSVLQDADYTITRSARGAELDGASYERLFDYLPTTGEICKVRTAEFVTTDEGTGIVHIAPPYGEDDLRLGQRYHLPVLHAVGDDGLFLSEIAPVAGLFFKDADPILTEILRERGLLYREERKLHSYPFGWRTGDPLIYYAKNAWYIRTTSVRDRMVELNKTIEWVPASIRDGRFGKWLEGNVDWALSRERFWGTPLPLWTDGEGDYLCLGSIKELEDRVGRSLQGLDLHRPAIDNVTFLHEGREYRRVAEVIDGWFDSGAMPYAQWNYPSQLAKFDLHFPADFICEAIDQTRGWFYTLHAIATMVSDSVAYRNVVCLSHIVDEDGKKMSKSLGNIVNPFDVFDTVGADPLRWHFAARVAPDMQKRVSVDIVSGVASSFINTYWNTYAFFVMYASLDRFDIRAQPDLAERPETDRWILSVLEETIARATEALDRYDALRAGRAIENFVDLLSNWYVRGNRRRFWKAESGVDKQSAYATLYECLETINRMMAPFMPFLSEAVYQNLVRRLNPDAPTSVHMAAWPEHHPKRLDRTLLADMKVVQQVITLGRIARNESNLKVRQPLSRLLVRLPDELASAAVGRHSEQIRDELNVKAVEIIPRDATLITYRIKPNLPVVGKKYGKLIPAIRAALAQSDGGAIAKLAARGELLRIEVEGQTIELAPDALLIETIAAEGFACAEDAGYLVGLDTTLSDELVREGLIREIVRTVQDARKQAGLNVSDRIVLNVDGNEPVMAAMSAHREYIASEALVNGWQQLSSPPAFSIEHSLGAARWGIRLARDSSKDEKLIH
jgi:isoleucyl-tRNA synthetase